MPKSMAREKRSPNLDTEDHVTERILEATAWAETHRRAVLAAGIALVAVVAAAFYYRDYRERLVERASVRLQEIQLTARSADAESMRSELYLFIDQYSGTPYADQARVALAELELRRDSLSSAIRVLQPVADLGADHPLSYTAIQMIGAAYEQGGDTESALQWYARLASEARFEYQRREALAAQARLYATTGRYGEAEGLYEELVEADDDPTAQNIYAVRLGELRTAERFGTTSAAALPTITDGAETGPEAAGGTETGEPAAEVPSDDASGEEGAESGTGSNGT